MEHRPLACPLSGFLNPLLSATRAKDHVMRDAVVVMPVGERPAQQLERCAADVFPHVLASSL